MRKTFALAALLAATALSPALAQDAATEAEPTPIPERVMVQMSRGEGREARGPRGGDNNGDGQRPQWQGNRGGGDNGGGWQRREMPQPAPQTAPQPVPQAAPQPMPQRSWNGGGGRWQGSGQGGWQGRGQGSVATPQGQPAQQPDWSQRRGDGNWGNRGWQRREAPVTTTPAPQAPQTAPGWQGRNDSWRNNGGNRWGGTVQGQPPQTPRNDGWRNDGRRNDTWRDNGRRDGWNSNDGRNDSWRNDGRRNGWNGNNSWNGRNDTWRNDSWRNNGRAYDRRPEWQQQYRGWTRNWSNDWRRDQRYDWQRYRSYNRDLYRADRYYAPYGWTYGYRRYGVGFTLSWLLYDQQYWIDDPWSYRLPETYGPYRWVRYYDDVLLVDLRNGRVVDVIYDFFW